MTEDRHDAEATATRKGRRGPVVAGPDARQAEKPAGSTNSAGEPPEKASDEAPPVTPTHPRGKNATPAP